MEVNYTSFAHPQKLWAAELPESVALPLPLAVCLPLLLPYGPPTTAPPLPLPWPHGPQTTALPLSLPLPFAFIFLTISAAATCSNSRYTPSNAYM